MALTNDVFDAASVLNSTQVQTKQKKEKEIKLSITQIMNVDTVN